MLLTLLQVRKPMTMYDNKDVKVKTIEVNCKKCGKFLGFNRLPKSLDPIGENFCNYKCENDYVEAKGH